MNEKEFKVFKEIHESQSIYLRDVVKNTKLPYGTVQGIINRNLDLFDCSIVGKQKYFSFNKSDKAISILKQINLMNSEEEYSFDRLDELESQSIFILREAFANLDNLCMLWSIGKDSTVLLWLARKAFLGHIPFPLVHIDTSFKIPEMIEYRDKLAKEYKLVMIYGQNKTALKQKLTFPDGKISRIDCCKKLKTEALKNTLNGSQTRWILNLDTGKYEQHTNMDSFTGVIAGVRSDEEGSRSKERYFSARSQNNDWNVDDQPPELWNQFKTDFPKGEHVRVHPLLDWTELDIWKYIERENIPTVSLYYDQGEGKRYRSLGCYPCTSPIKSTAKNVREVVEELESGNLKDVAERSGREQDKEDKGGGLETLRREGYM